MSNILLIVSYSLIAIVSLIGNLLVIKVVYSHRLSRTTTNVLIGNLAVADLLMTIINIPFNITRVLLDNWPFGQLLCITVPLIQTTSVYCSTITMMVIALERYRTLVNNNGFKNMFYTLSMIWLVSLLLSLPHGVFNKVIVLNDWQNLTRCRVQYPIRSDIFRKGLTVFTLITQYVLPILLTCLCYTRICYSLCKRKFVGIVTDRHRNHLIRHKRRRIKVLVLVVLVFAICWLPFNIYHLLVDFDIINFSLSLFFLNHWLAMSNVCYNPFIYCWMNNDFQNKLRVLFKCLSTRNTINNNNNNNNNDNSTVNETVFGVNILTDRFSELK
ncbi:G-protein coupled receptor 83-like [Oppia nitens]|uniref:G-protein coupled receptor 83-like n=1 Tax=Oppia nitens TaxID=1686743 RepID=UPI0023DAC199|nr:G-protein coupled receptor 83-like [Oppia nitens]